MRMYLAKGYELPDTEPFALNLTDKDIIETFYTTQSLIESFQALESDYTLLRHNISLVPYYNTLVDNIAHKWHQNQSDVQLKYLYTLVKSRLFGIEMQKNYVAVADLSSFLTTIKDNVLDLRTIENRDHIDKYRQTFVDKLEEKIKAADDLIENTLLPFIDGKINDTKGNIDDMKKELNDASKQADKALENAKKNEETLKKRAIANAIVGAFDLVATGLSALGPQCQIIGAGIKAATAITNVVLDHTLKEVPVNPPKLLNKDRVMKVAKNAAKQCQDIA